MDEFCLPSIAEVPFICIYINIARYMSEEDCRHVFIRVLPKWKAIYDLIRAERESMFAHRKVSNTVFYKEVTTDTNMISFVPQSCFLIQCSSSIAPLSEMFFHLYPPEFRHFLIQLYRKNIDVDISPDDDMNKFWKVAVGIAKRHVESMGKNIIPHKHLRYSDLLDVSTDDEELWYAWRGDFLFNNMPHSDRREAIELMNQKHGLINFQTASSLSGGWIGNVWSSFDRKLLFIQTGEVSDFFCLGVRHRSKKFLEDLVNISLVEQLFVGTLEESAWWNLP